jgi:hypothetical protein
LRLCRAEIVDSLILHGFIHKCEPVAYSWRRSVRSAAFGPKELTELTNWL